MRGRTVFLAAAAASAPLWARAIWWYASSTGLPKEKK